MNRSRQELIYGSAFHVFLLSKITAKLDRFFFFYPGVNREQAEMQKFTTKIVDMMKSEGLFEWQGGPIILSQVCLQLISFDMF